MFDITVGLKLIKEIFLEKLNRSRQSAGFGNNRLMTRNGLKLTFGFFKS